HAGTVVLVATTDSPELISNLVSFTVSVDKSLLEDLLDYVGSLSPDDWSASSWADLDNAWNQAQIVYDGDHVSQMDIEDAIQSLTDVLAALTVDKSGLADAIADATALTESDYSEASWADLQTALTAADAVNGDNEAVQSAVDAAEQALGRKSAV